MMTAQCKKQREFAIPVDGEALSWCFCENRAKSDVEMIELVEECDLSGFVAVIPSVCIGNVGQLASDLLISSLNLRKLGYVWHPQVYAFCGAEPFQHSNSFSTACELFFSNELRLLVFQIRSAHRRNIKNFLEEICDWLKENKIRQVIVLAGISAHGRRDRQLVGEPLRYVFCPLTKLEESKSADSRNWVELENQVWENGSSDVLTSSHMPGIGTAVKWFNKCVSKKIPCSILVEFCSEGNNTPEALKLVGYLNEWLHLKERHQIDSWIIPPSWNLLFGSKPPAEIFN